MKHNSLGTNLIKAYSQKMVKFWWKPEITDLFLDRIESESKEWKTPPEGDVTIFHYHDKYHHLDSKYTINRDWEVKWLKWEVMKPFFHPNKHWPRVRIQIEKKDKDGKSVFLEKEIWILQIMGQKFGIYFPWYWLKKMFPKDYILEPKDWNYNNMRYNNLQYVCKDEKTKKKLIKDYLKNNSKIDNETIAKVFNTRTWYIRKIRQEMVNEGHISQFSEYQKLKKEIWIEFSEDKYEIYKILIQDQWESSNMEIAKHLWPKEMEKTEDKSFYTNKIVRARKKLTDKWLIPRFNEIFESKRDEAICMIRNKIDSGKTNQEIANILWLKKSQIDNLVKQLKKEEKNKDSY